MKTSEVLDLAADLIEERGWTEGGWGYGDGAPICLEGGIMAAAGTADFVDELWACPAYRAVADYLGYDVTVAVTREGFQPQPRQPLWRWNDQSGRTQAEVIAVLRAVSAVVSARESQPAAVSA